MEGDDEMIVHEKEPFSGSTEAGRDHIAIEAPNEQPKKLTKAPVTLPMTASDFRIFIYEVTESKAFGGAILFVILLNTAILIAQTSEELILRGGKLLVADSVAIDLTKGNCNYFKKFNNLTIFISC